jgi:hypothetical protein
VFSIRFENYGSIQIFGLPTGYFFFFGGGAGAGLLCSVGGGAAREGIGVACAALSSDSSFLGGVEGVGVACAAFSVDSSFFGASALIS